MEQAISRVSICVKGRGVEAKLEFDPSLATFGPSLPHGPGVEQIVTVRNPCPFPIEFYSLNFDEQYLNEEKVSSHFVHLLFFQFVPFTKINFIFNYFSQKCL